MIELDLDGWKEVQSSRELKVSQVFYDAMQEFFIVYEAFQEATGAVETKSKRPFSVCYHEMREMFHKAKNEDREITDEEIKSIPEMQSQDLERDSKTLQRVLYDQHEFIVSPETMETFHEEMWVLFEARYVRQLYIQAWMCDPELLRLAKMKGMYAMGQAVSLLRELGRTKSDLPSTMGKRPSKNHVGVQAVYEAFHYVEWEGRKMIHIGELIESYLLEREEKKPKSRQKKVYCADYIAKKILPKDEEIKKILLREGILKK